MKPDRSNYEIWIIDWLDGKLSASDEKLLMDFLEVNPDISEEASFLKSARTAEGDNTRGKWDNLLRKPTDIPASQVEYLSVGFLENDLSPEQESDLMQSIALNNENRDIFESVQKTRLSPPEVKFKNKAGLRRTTPVVKITRYVFASLSAAAAILFLVLNHLFIPENFNMLSAASTSDTIFIEQTTKYFTHPSRSAHRPQVVPVPVKIAERAADTNIILREEGPSPLLIASVPSVETPRDRIPLMLAMSQINFDNTTARAVEEDDRGMIGKFLARTFRSKILREKQGSDAPVQTYEFAQAGINGLNKLLGWQMALEKTSDSLGNVKSLYFSSRVLKFNAPVKKVSELQ